MNGQPLNGKYRLGRLLGAGAQGDVYEATLLPQGTTLAVKLFHAGHGGKELLSSLERLKGNYVSSCAAVLDAFEHDGRVAAVLELLDGQPLAEFIKREDWSVKKREDLCERIIEAVRSLHEEGLAHGDLSPGNVFVCGEGVKLIDPRILAGRSASVLGTANYAAPELLTFNSPPTRAGDVFGLAALLYEVFEGHDPFGCQSAEEYMLKAGTRSLERRPFNRTPLRFRDMIAAGLELDPKARPKTVERLAGRQRARGRLALYVGAAALLAAGAAFLGIRLSKKVSYDEMLDAKVLRLEDRELFVIGGVGKAPFYLRQHPGSNRMVVCNAHSPYLSIIDLSARPLLAGKVALGGHHSHDFVPYASNTRALVSSSVTDSVVVLDLSTMIPVKVLSNEPERQWFLHPDAIAVSEQNSHAYVTSWRGGFVTVIDLKTLRPVKRIDVYPGPSGAVVSRDGQSVYVSHTVVRFNPERRITEGVVTVIDTKTNRVSRKIPNVGKESSDVKLLPGTDVAITANFRGQSISMISTTGQERISDIALRHGSPIDQAVSARRPYIYVANFNHPYIHIVDHTTGKILLVLQSKHFGRETNGIALSPDEKFLCLTNTEADQVVCLENRIEDWERLAR